MFLEDFKRNWNEFLQTKDGSHALMSMIGSLILLFLGMLVYTVFSNWVTATVGILLSIAGIVLLVYAIILLALVFFEDH